MTTTVGDPNPDWDTGKHLVRDGFLELADLASRHNVIVAAEPHAGGDFNTPEKAVWLMENTRHDSPEVELRHQPLRRTGNRHATQHRPCAYRTPCIRT